MAIAPPPTPGGRTLVRNGLMQNDLDADFHKILNLDTSNLVLDPIPAQSAPPHTWYNSYDPGIHHFGSTQPNFLDISGKLTTAQQLEITVVGTITTGTWHGSTIGSLYLPSLDTIRPPVSDLNLNNHKITNLADAIDPQDAVNLRMVERVTGQNPKAAVRVASTGNVSLLGLVTIDGVPLVAGDRVLVKNQPSFRLYQNGIYVAATGGWARSVDADTGAELVLASTFVLEGTTNAGTTWLQTTPPPITLNATNIVWELISRVATGDLVFGAGLNKTGNTVTAVGTFGRISVSTGIDISASYAGQASITTLGTITSGAWNGSVIGAQYGGTGIANAAGSVITLAGPLSTALQIGAPIDSPVTFTITNPTNVTLPVTGTLATLGGVETFTNKHIGASQIDSGAVAIAFGGTAATTAQDAANNILPEQLPIHAGKALITDGFGNLSWGTPV